MFNILANGNKLAYGVKKFMVTNADEIKNIPLTSNVACGSIVLVTSTGSQYVLDASRKWVKIHNASSGGGDVDEEVIYNGGDLAEDGVTDDELNYDGGSF